uniref:Tail protein n=1 Tax=viral metagenome TaxID=1070528 RepID=A0A6M3K7V1_9ZZZZ
MATTYPGTLDSFATSGGTSPLTNPDHSERHNSVGSAVEALEAKAGVGAGTPVANTILAGSGNGTSAWTGTIPTLALGSAVYSGTVSGTFTLDLAAARRHRVNMPDSAGSVTLAVSNGAANVPFIVEVLQGTAGLGTIGWFTGITWANAAIGTLTTTASKMDTYGFLSNSGTTFYGFTIGTNI